MRQPLKHIWLLLIPGQMHAWEIVRGICRFAKNRRWVMTICNPNVPPAKSVLDTASIDGMIGLIYKHEFIDTIKRRKIAAVNMIRGHDIGNLPSVLVDDYMCGQMAADYFVSRGFSNFGFLGSRIPESRSTNNPPHSTYATERERGFTEFLEQCGRPVRFFSLTLDELTRTTHIDNGKTTPGHLSQLHSLPKPIAIFTTFDPMAVDLANECQTAGIHVPDEVAILGVHNGQILCEMSSPPLSSIETASEQRGYIAAQMLDKQFNGDLKPQETVVLPPVGIVSRASTDVIAVDNPIVAEALHYIRDHLAQGVDVAEVVEHLAVSRRQLERCFQNELQRTPLEEIHRLRVARAMDLLATTTLSMTAVAMQAGYSRADRMSMAVRKTAGMSPIAYRAMFHDK